MGGAIIFAHGVDGRGIAEVTLVFGERARIEEAQALRSLGEFLLDKIIRVRTHQALRKIVRLDHEEPMPRERAPSARHIVEQVMLRHDVENGGARHFLRMVEAHAMQHARAAIVAGGVEARKSQRRHHLDLVLCHGAERIAGMVRPVGRFFGIAVAA